MLGYTVFSLFVALSSFETSIVGRLHPYNLRSHGFIRTDLKNLEQSASCLEQSVLAHPCTMPLPSFLLAGSGKLNEYYQEMGSIEVGPTGRENLAMHNNMIIISGSYCIS